MSQYTTTQTTNKHHQNGDGAACPSSGVVRVAGGRAHSFSKAADKGFSLIQ